MSVLKVILRFTNLPLLEKIVNTKRMLENLA